MTDPGVKPQRGFFDRLKIFFGLGEKRVEVEEKRHTEPPDPTSGGVRTMTVKEAAWWIGGRSPGDGTEIYRQIMAGQIRVVRSDGTIYGDGQL